MVNFACAFSQGNIEWIIMRIYLFTYVFMIWLQHSYFSDHSVICDKLVFAKTGLSRKEAYDKAIGFISRNPRQHFCQITRVWRKIGNYTPWNAGEAWRSQRLVETKENMSFSSAKNTFIGRIIFQNEVKCTRANVLVLIDVSKVLVPGTDLPLTKRKVLSALGCVCTTRWLSLLHSHVS